MAAAAGLILGLWSCEETYPDPSISVNPDSISDVPYEGSTYTANVTANGAWTAIPDGEHIVVSPASGNGDAPVTITIGQNPLGITTTLQVIFTCENEAGAMSQVLMSITQEGLPEGVIEYAGVQYQTELMKDGRVWMTENLRYIPDGMSVSSDPADGSGLWYPNYGNDAALTDEESINTYGYLYTPFVAMGINPEDVNADNYESFEGTRGICLEGWHIPTEAEAQALVDAYWDEDQSGAPISSLDSDGFNTELGGFVQRNDSGATGRYLSTMPGYIICSTGQTYSVNDEGVITSANKALMKTNTTAYQRFTVANIRNYAGASVRCIKDAE